MAFETKRIKYVVASVTQFQSEKLTPLGYPAISDVTPGFGVWSAIHAALKYGESEWIFVLACDLPFVTVEFLQFLTEFVNDDLDAIIPRQVDERIQPLCAFYRRTATLVAVEAFLSLPDPLPRLSAICSDLKTKIVEYNENSGFRDSSRFLVNVNTPDELEPAGKRRI